MEIANTMLSSELQVFLNYVYEYKKGVRNMVPVSYTHLRINVKTYDAEPLPEGDTSGNRVIVTVDDNTLKYYFVVVANRGTNVSTESNESEVIKHVESPLKKYKLLDAELKRRKFAITIGDELPSGILQMAKVYVAKKRWLSDLRHLRHSI